MEKVLQVEVREGGLFYFCAGIFLKIRHLERDFRVAVYSYISLYQTHSHAEFLHSLFK